MDGGALPRGCTAQYNLCYIYINIETAQKVISGWFYIARRDPFHVFPSKMLSEVKAKHIRSGKMRVNTVLYLNPDVFRTEMLNLAAALQKALRAVPPVGD